MLISGQVTTISAVAARRGVPSPAPEGVEFEQHDHHNDQDVQDKAESHRRHTPLHGERPVFGPVQPAADVFEGAAPGTERTAVLSNAGRSYPNGPERLHPCSGSGDASFDFTIHVIQPSA
jgi:hypothetical protein